MTATITAQLAKFGPEHCEVQTLEQARAMCRRLAMGHYENFSVLSVVVPRPLRDDFAALYAFCRWADDLGDEIGNAAHSLELLAWWRQELRRCYEGIPRHPVFMALHPVIVRHELPMELFDDLIKAFEQDQRVPRYATWSQLIDYCRLSANPVGRLVLMMCGENRTEQLWGHADAICTALQLVNHWQDVRRDLLDRDRVYIPQELIPNDHVLDFENRLRASAQHGYGIDREFLSLYRAILRECVNRTWTYFESGDVLFHQLASTTRPIVWLFSAGGQHVLRTIEMWNYETALHRPQLGRLTKIGLIARAWWMSRHSKGALVSKERSS